MPVNRENIVVEFCATEKVHAGFNVEFYGDLTTNTGFLENIKV